MSFAPAHRCHKGLVLCSALSIGLLAACTTEGEPTGAVSGASLDSPGVEQTSDVQAEGTAADAESAAPEEAGTTEPASAAEDDVLYAEVDDPVTFEVCEEAEESEHAAVTWLDDEVIEEQEIEAVPSDSVEIDGEEVEIPGSSAIVIPERVAQGGCTIEYTAPSACLPAVEISGSFVPGYTLPGRTLPEVELPDGTVLEEMVQEEIEVAAVEHDGVFQEEVCQTSEEDAEDGDEAGEYNQQLSEDRAQAVADWMEDHADVDTSDLTVEGYGMDHPRADNSTEEGRAENRRVVITAEEI